MWRLLLGTMGVKSLVQGLNAAATAGFEPRTVWSEVRRRNRLATAPSRMEFNFVLSEWLKEIKTRRDARKVCKPGGRKFGMEINFVLFLLYKIYEIKFPTKISSFTVARTPFPTERWPTPSAQVRISGRFYIASASSTCTLIGWIAKLILSFMK